MKRIFKFIIALIRISSKLNKLGLALQFFPSLPVAAIKLQWLKSGCDWKGMARFNVSELWLGHPIDRSHSKFLERTLYLKKAGVKSLYYADELATIMESDGPIEIVKTGKKYVVVNGNGRVAAIKWVNPDARIYATYYKKTGEV